MADSEATDMPTKSKRRRFRDLSPEEQVGVSGRVAAFGGARVLAEAVLKLFPEAKLTIGPPIRDGFYYDFDVSRPFTPEDLDAIENEMRTSIGANTAFVEREVTREEARELVTDNRYKQEIIDGIPEDERVTFTSHSNGEFDDLCRGGHVEFDRADLSIQVALYCRRILAR